MPRDRNRVTRPDSPFQPAWRLWRRYGISGWKLQRMAEAGRIRQETSTTVFTRYCEEDVKALAEELGIKPTVAAERASQAVGEAK